jgi:hypothetical protein
VQILKIAHNAWLQYLYKTTSFQGLDLRLVLHLSTDDLSQKRKQITREMIISPPVQMESNTQSQVMNRSAFLQHQHIEYGFMPVTRSQQWSGRTFGQIT